MPASFSEPILHVDMDAFFVEVERLRRPELAGRPVVVGGLGSRGVVAAASYEARRFGVHSAMPTAHARRLCAHAVFLPADHHAYRAASEQVFEVLRSFSTLVEGLSLDEAFVDVSGLRLHHPDGEVVGRAIRQALRTELGLPASVGVAASKFVAKLASEAAKPDGLLRVRAGTELDFLHPLPVGALWGVGEATRASLEQLGVRTIGDLADLPVATLARRLGPALGAHLRDLAWARDSRGVEPDHEAKSVSVERTFERDLDSARSVERELLALCERLASRLRRSDLAGLVVTIKVRFGDFTTVTRSAGVESPTNVGRDLYAAALQLLGRVPGGRPVRLLGVGVSDLVGGDAPRQLALDRGPVWDDLAETVDRIRLRFGDGAVGPARLGEEDR